MLTDSARKKFKFQVTPSDRQLWAIGMVAVQWTQIELMVKTYVHGLTDKDETARTVFDSTHSMEGRLDQWQALVELRVMQPWQAQMLQIVNETKQVKELRDKIIHGAWAGKPNSGELPDGESYGPFS